MRTLLLLLAQVLSTVAFAQFPPFDPLTEKVLVPIRLGDVAGGYGSQWQTTLWVTNSSNTQVVVGGTTGLPCHFQCTYPPLPGQLLPSATWLLTQMVTSPSIPAGFLRTEPGRSDDLTFTLHTRDLSRAHETWGTVVPVVRSSDFFDRAFDLVGIPTSAQFRILIRLYDTEPLTPPALVVKFYRINPDKNPYDGAPEPDELLGEMSPTWTFPEQPTLWHPAYAQFDIPQGVRTSELIRVRIEPTAGLREYWGFASITDNVTQHVTIITPQ